MDDVDESVVRRWSEKSNGEYIARMWKLWSEEVGVFHEHSDGARIGIPAKETVYDVVSHAASKTSA